MIFGGKFLVDWNTVYRIRVNKFSTDLDSWNNTRHWMSMYLKHTVIHSTITFSSRLVMKQNSNLNFQHFNSCTTCTLIQLLSDIHFTMRFKWQRECWNNWRNPYNIIIFIISMIATANQTKFYILKVWSLIT